MTQDIRFGEGAVRHVHGILRWLRAGSVLLVTGRSSYERSGASAALQDGLASLDVRRHVVSTLTLGAAEIGNGLEAMAGASCDAILAVGGGAVLDAAKLIGICSAHDAPAMDIVLGRAGIERAGPPVIAVPTTAGSGSEATRFAVVYTGHDKHSIAHELLLPAHAIVDPRLTYSLSPRWTAITGLDALSQAVESLWSVRATDASKARAREAAALAHDALLAAVHEPAPANRRAMCRAAHLAGQAIDETRTTAPHAVSYAMTSFFGVPHGHAVALTLGPFLLFNSRVDDGDVADARGAAYVRDQIAAICDLLGGGSPEDVCARIQSLVRSTGLPDRLAAAGIRTAADRRLLADRMNAERAGNNPRRVTKDALWRILEAIA
jgi:alcohol dehydrogenase class IV